MKISKNLKFVGISVLIIVGLAACDKQGATATAGNKMPGNSQQVATLNGTYKSEEGFKNGDFSVFTRYPDGAYIESFYSIKQGNTKSTVDFIRVGKYQQNGDQLEYRQTGVANSLLSNGIFGPTNVEITEIIKMDADGNYRTKRSRLIVDGQLRPDLLDDKWSGKYFPVHLQNQTEMENKMRQSIPAQFFQ